MNEVKVNQEVLNKILSRIKELETKLENFGENGNYAKLESEVNSLQKRESLNEKEILELIKNELGAASEGLRTEAQSEITEAKEAIRATLTEEVEQTTQRLSKELTDWLDERFDKLEAQIDQRLGDFRKQSDNFNSRLEAIERNQKTLNQSYKKLKDRLELVIDRMHEGFTRADKRFARLEK